MFSLREQLPFTGVWFDNNSVAGTDKCTLGNCVAKKTSCGGHKIKKTV